MDSTLQWIDLAGRALPRFIEVFNRLRAANPTWTDDEVIAAARAEVERNRTLIDAELDKLGQP